MYYVIIYLSSVHKHWTKQLQLERILGKTAQEANNFSSCTLIKQSFLSFLPLPKDRDVKHEYLLL